MSAPASSRERILSRIHAATPGAGSAEEALRSWSALPRAYVGRGALSAQSRIELMIERLREYDAETSACTPEELPSAIAAQLARSGRSRILAPEGLPRAWLAPGFEWMVDRGLELAVIETADGVVTACFCGVADSGTIVLHHAPEEGRRALSLLPDWHLCILRASQVVETLPEYFRRCRELPAIPSRVTWISGPSATADIEMTRIKGVHGPRFLNVILVHDESAAAKGKEDRKEEDGIDRARQEGTR
jgi:L-lactate dehydrogenase complex protein LldG